MSRDCEIARSIAITCSRRGTGATTIGTEADAIDAIVDATKIGAAADAGVEAAGTTGNAAADRNLFFFLPWAKNRETECDCTYDPS